MALPIRQIAYFVPDVRVAAARHAALFGSGRQEAKLMGRDLLPLSAELPADLLAEIEGARETLAAAKAGSTTAPPTASGAS